jgi:RNA recognition motif-containing protein
MQDLRARALYSQSGTTSSPFHKACQTSYKMSGARHWYVIISNPRMENLFANYSTVREQDKEATVYIGNIDERVTDSLIWELMLQAGRIVNVHLPKDRVTQSHQGYGFVEFISEEDAEYAARIMNQVRLYGKPIRVNKVSPHNAFRCESFIDVGIFRLQRISRRQLKSVPSSSLVTLIPWLTRRLSMTRSPALVPSSPPPKSLATPKMVFPKAMASYPIPISRPQTTQSQI